jgi:hypothetical protein
MFVKHLDRLKYFYLRLRVCRIFLQCKIFYLHHLFLLNVSDITSRFFKTILALSDSKPELIKIFLNLVLFRKRANTIYMVIKINAFLG